MSYLGSIPQFANFVKLDDISSEFNGSKTEFEVTQSSNVVSIPSARQCLIVLNGVLQNPEVDFSVDSTQTKINFLNYAPESGDTFFGIIIGSSYDIGTVSDGTITLEKLDTGTHGEILYYGNSGVPKRLSPGTEGQFLRTNGPNSDPSWSEGLETGDILPTFRNSAKSGFLLMRGDTIGNSLSGADFEGSAYYNLFLFLWEYVNNTNAPVSGGRGSDAISDWNAGKTITIPDPRGRALVGAGQGSGLSLNLLSGEASGNENITIAKTNLPATGLSFSGTTGSGGNHNHTIGTGTVNIDGAGAGFNVAQHSTAGTIQSTNSAGNHNHSFSGTTENMGSGTPLEILQPMLAVNWQIKL